MKKTVLLIASIMMQVMTTPLAYGQTYYTESGIQNHPPSGVLGNTATFNMSLDLGSSLWYQYTGYGDLVVMFEYGESVGTMYLETDEEEIDSQTGGASVDANYMEPLTTYFYRAVVYRENNPSIRWISSTQSIQSFNSGSSAQADAELSDPDTIGHRFAGPLTGIVATPDFPGQYYNITQRICINSTCMPEIYLGSMEANEIDTFEIMVEGEPGDDVSVQLRAHNYDVGSTNEWWGGQLKPSSVPEVFLSVPEVTSSNMTLSGEIAYGGYDTQQWFEVVGPEPVVTIGPLNRGNYSGVIQESILTPTTPGIYTVTLHANNFIGDNQTSVEFEVLDPTGIDDLESSDVLMYPNPATDMAMITLPVDAKFAVTSVAGQVVASGQIKANQIKNVGLNIPRGMYSVSFVTEDTQIHKQLIVQ